MRRRLIIKDHCVAGFLAQQRIALIDWAANAPYDVPCLYRYHTLDGWRASQARHGLRPVAEQTAMKLYPPMYDWIFGGRLQYFAVLERAAH